ncbi:PAS domain S-box protein [Aequorivita marisscotiae]|uniref:histidine kinase n=1 Tax=Aequorivita marisscotiae TaxID=3040348 RepID=A0ABY8KRS2_9FLAO|nr:PAS domain S-box protein [Aequorivita sp. Ant34-E75]WGF92159.1 PAS domain S-box protein [Aequorivita sp. Ant34-E75]
MSSSIEKYNFPDQEIFDLYPFPMWIYDVETLRFLAVNQEAIKHYGYSEAEFMSMTIKDIRPEEEIPRLLKAVKETRARTKQYKDYLYVHQKKDGSLIRVQIKSNLLHFKGRQADIVTAIDLTEHYLQEKRISEQKQYLAIIGELNQLLLRSENWVVALNRCFQIVGDTLEIDRVYFFQNNLEKNTTSQRLEWVRDSSDMQIDNPELQHIPYSQFPLFINQLQEGKLFEAIVSELPNTPIKHILQKQNIRSILVLPVMINREFSGFIGIDDCVHERRYKEHELALLKNLASNLGHVIKAKQAQQKLIDSEARFRSLVQNGTDLIAIINKEGFYTYVAPNSTKVLGIPPKDFIGKNAFDFIYEEDAPRLLKHLEEILTTERVSIAPFRFPDVHGNWRWIQTELTNHLQDPAINGIVANTKDVTPEVEKNLGKELVASLTKHINGPGSLSTCLTEALKELIKLSGIHISEAWLISEDSATLNLISKWQQDIALNEFYDSSKEVHSFKIGSGYPGHIWQSKESFIWQDIQNCNTFVRTDAADITNLNSAIGIPIIFNEEFLGCIICFSQFEDQYLSEYLKILVDVGQQIGAVVKQKMIAEEYHNFFDISPDPHCLVGLDGTLIKYNKAFKNLLGYTNAEIKNSPILKYVIFKEDRAAFIEILKTNPDSISSFESKLRTKSGAIKWLRWSATINKEAKVIVAVAKDITEQKIAEQSLEAAYLRLRNAQKIAKLGYWSRNLDTDLSDWSEEMYAIFGYTVSNFTPTLENIARTFHPSDRHLFLDNIIVDSLKPGQVKSFEHRIITATNEVRWVRQEARLILDDAGKPARLEGTIQDINESKEIQQQLAYSNERFRLAMQASNEMIWEIDHQKQTVSRGKGYEGTLHYDTSEPFVIDNSWFGNVHPEDLPDLWESLQTAFRNKEKKSWEREYRLLKEDGSIAYFVDRCYIIRDEEGNPIRSIGSALNVTISRQQLEQIKRQNTNLREIAWMQSHVIRAPLSKIMGLIYLSELEDKDQATNEIFKMISDAAHELDEVIHKITHKINTIENEDA